MDEAAAWGNALRVLGGPTTRQCLVVDELDGRVVEARPGGYLLNGVSNLALVGALRRRVPNRVGFD
ncbi:hypothetical protein VB773_01665 [Haloarculaceae archaeon H-GB2-1]|nr:hypothetical protein [Haloarculaceae archaeon H-GB1-1]MEA5406415.1 hypothetical protein [Haloarculaceae archaeon H-GB2-1]